MTRCQVPGPGLCTMAASPSTNPSCQLRATGLRPSRWTDGPCVGSCQHCPAWLEWTPCPQQGGICGPRLGSRTRRGWGYDWVGATNAKTAKALSCPTPAKSWRKQQAGHNLPIVGGTPDARTPRHGQPWGQDPCDTSSHHWPLLSSLRPSRTCSVQAQNLLVNQHRAQALETEGD